MPNFGRIAVVKYALPCSRLPLFELALAPLTKATGNFSIFAGARKDCDNAGCG